MRALVVEKLAPDYAGCVVKTIPAPDPGPGEVRIRVRAAAVNFPDLMQTRGEHQHKPPVPFTPGMELAGDVDAVGEGVTAFKPGDPVCGGGRGGMAEFAVLPAAGLRRKPETLTYSQAAGYPVAYLTAYVAFERCARLQAGEWVLIHGAAGGVGLAAVDLARIMGAKVIAASASDHKLDIITREYAPDATVNVTRSFREQVKAITGGKGVLVVYDSIGKATFLAGLDCLATRGIMVTYGNASGAVDPFAPGILAGKGSLMVTRPTLASFTRTPQELQETADDLFAVIASGKVKIAINQRHALKDAAKAQEELAAKKTTGATILIP